MNINDYLKHPPSSPPNKLSGISSRWLDFCKLRLHGSKLHVVDASYVEDETAGQLIKLARGIYSVQVKLRIYGIMARVARLRILRLNGKSSYGKLIGHVGIDTGRIALYDYKAVDALWKYEDHQSWKVLEGCYRSTPLCGLAIMDKASGVTIPYMRTGFGDGRFEIHELLMQRNRTGIEVIFIKPRSKNPELLTHSRRIVRFS
jgi:hypothetical protein